MRLLLERFGGFIPVVIALTLPVVYLPSASDQFILPRASLAVAGACLCVGVALLIPTSAGLGNLRLPLALAACAAVLAFAFSISWPLSFAGAYTRYESLPVRLSYLGLLAGAAWLLRSSRQRDWLVGAFVFSVAIAAIKAWWQWMSQVPFRPDGDLGNANLLAALVVMALPLAIDRARRNSPFVFAWAASLLPLAAGLYVTTSRSGDLGAVAACLALLAFSVPRRYLLALGGLSAGVAALALGFFFLTPLRTLNGDPPELRLHLWADGLRLVLARPLTGWGEDATGLSFGGFLSRDYAGLVTFDRIHSGPLDVAATQGILGLAALAWVVGIVLLTAWRRRGVSGVPGLAAALVGFSVWVFFNFDWAPATAGFWLLAGTLWSLLRAPERPVAQALSPQPAPPRWGAPLAVTLVILAVPLAVLPLFADNWYVRGHPDLSVRVDPLQAQYHWAIGTVPELQAAAGLGETEPGMYVQLGDRERELGHLAAARRAYERALAIDPYYTPAAERLKAL